MKFSGLVWKTKFILMLGGLACLAAAGCSSRDPNWKETVPVSGIVLADGQPAEGVTVVFNPVAGMDQAQPTVTQSMTDAEGKFSASTYQSGDGVPEGEYKLTFTWGKLNPISMTFDGDKFKGRYKDPKKSDYSVNVVAGDPMDLGTFELRTK